MTKKKNKFLTFCCSLIPGAGEMYMGFMKMGLSLMGMFFLIVTVAAMFELGPVVILAFIAWFYSFFHVHNLAGMADEEFYAVEDEYLFHLGEDGNLGQKLSTQYRKIIAVVLILLGVLLIWNSMYWVIMQFMPEGVAWVIREIGYRLPKLVIGIAIVMAGIYMIRGKKKSLETEQEVQ